MPDDRSDRPSVDRKLDDARLVGEIHATVKSIKQSVDETKMDLRDRTNLLFKKYEEHDRHDDVRFATAADERQAIKTKLTKIAAIFGAIIVVLGWVVPELIKALIQ